MIGLIFGETDFPIQILKKIKKRKLKYLIIDLSKSKKFKKDKNSHNVSIGQFGKIIMIKKIILLLAIISPFLGYYFTVYLLKFEKKKIPVLKLSILSLVLLVSVLIFFRYFSHISPDTKYYPPKVEDGKVIPAENK